MMVSRITAFVFLMGAGALIFQSALPSASEMSLDAPASSNEPTPPLEPTSYVEGMYTDMDDPDEPVQRRNNRRQLMEVTARSPFMFALDANRDGVISQGEAEEAPAILRGLDHNKDGKVAVSELTGRRRAPKKKKGQNKGDLRAESSRQGPAWSGK